jgi:pimeloyl-ACP methyl ester carboxylesterase
MVSTSFYSQFPHASSNTGTPSEHNCYADIEAIFDYLIENRGLSPHQVVLYGRSLGSGPSCWLAHKTAREGRSVGGLILHSPFTSVYRVVVNLGFTMVGDKFPNIDRIKEVVCPVVIVHGKDDTIVPIDHGMKLQDAVSERFQTKPLWMENTGHNDHGPVMEEALIGHLNSFLDYHILARRLWMNPPQQQRLASAQKRKNRLSSPTRLKRRHLLANRREV